MIFCFVYKIVCVEKCLIYILQKEVDYMKELYHHGIKGQKWGIRRFQNKDGTLTTAGKKRRIANEASNYYKREADERKKYGMDRIHEIDDIFEKDRGRYLSDQEVRKLLLEQDALEMAFSTFVCSL